MQVFPGLDPAQVDRLSAASYPDWDSVTQLLLIGLVEEKFQQRLGIEDIANLTSFELFLDHVRENDQR